VFHADPWFSTIFVPQSIIATHCYSSSPI